MSTSQHKIVILDNNQQRRDALKSMVVEWGHTHFVFEKESRCLDNLEPLDQDLLISFTIISAFILISCPLIRPPHTPEIYKI